MSTEKDELYTLFVEYMQELWQLSEDTKEDFLKEWFEKVYNAEDIEIYKIHLDEDQNEVAGFLVVKMLDEKHKKETGADRYICEVYVKPKYRKRGFLSSGIRDRFIKSGVPVTMHILKQREKAKIFWTNSLMKNFYTYETLDGKPVSDENISCTKVS